MLFGGDFAAAWGDQERISCFCFIGRNLDKMGIEEGFRSCIASNIDIMPLFSFCSVCLRFRPPPPPPGD